MAKPTPRPPLTAWERLLLEEPFEDAGPSEEQVRAGIKPKKPRARNSPGAYDLPRLNTRVLMVYLRGCQRMGSFDPTYSGGGRHITLEEVKAELAKRPHVPNKKEGEKLRREKSQGRPDPKKHL